MTDVNINLIRRCRAGDREAFAQLLSRHQGYLYRLCYGYLGRQEDALDVMQEVYIKVFRYLESFDEEREFRPWLKRIAINSCLNYRRQRNKEQPLSLERENEEGWSLLENLPAGDDVEEQVIGHTIQEDVRKCLELLPAGARMVITLHYFEDMPCREIAVLLDQPLGTVKNSLFRARKLIKDLLAKEQLLEV